MIWVSSGQILEQSQCDQILHGMICDQFVHVNYFWYLPLNHWTEHQCLIRGTFVNRLNPGAFLWLRVSNTISGKIVPSELFFLSLLLCSHWWCLSDFFSETLLSFTENNSCCVRFLICLKEKLLRLLVHLSQTNSFWVNSIWVSF